MFGFCNYLLVACVGDLVLLFQLLVICCFFVVCVWISVLGVVVVWVCWVVDWFALALIVTASGVVLGVSGLVCLCDCDLRGVGIIYVSGCFGVGWVGGRLVAGVGCSEVWMVVSWCGVLGFGWMILHGWFVCHVISNSRGAGLGFLVALVAS